MLVVPLGAAVSPAGHAEATNCTRDIIARLSFSSFPATIVLASGSRYAPVGGETTWVVLEVGDKVRICSKLVSYDGKTIGFFSLTDLDRGVRVRVVRRR